MLFPNPLISARLIKRYKRFLADVIFEDGTEATAHCANPGAMIGLANPGAKIWLSPATNPARKLRWSWEIEELPAIENYALVGINTSHPNKLAEEALRSGLLPFLKDYPHLRREVKYGKNSRIDILLENEDAEKCYIEVKNVHLCRTPNLAEFPDCKTERGAKHLAELSEIKKSGARAIMLYIIQRNDVDCFSIAKDLDHAYAEAFEKAIKQGVEAYAIDCKISQKAIAPNKKIKIKL
jgi:sugar fermentation stimulation protein A